MVVMWRREDHTEDTSKGQETGNEGVNDGVNGTLNGTLNSKQKDVLAFIAKAPGVQAQKIIDRLSIPRDTLNKREDGSPMTQCECIVYSERNDNRKGWLFFLELKYCEPKNRYDRMLGCISQLKTTCNYILKERQELDATLFNKMFLVVSTPGVEPLDPFDASYFDQDYILTVKEETG